MAATASGSLSALPYDILHQILYPLNLKQRAIASSDDCKFVITNTNCGYCSPNSCMECYEKRYCVIKHAAVDNDSNFHRILFVITQCYFFQIVPVNFWVKITNRSAFKTLQY